MLRSLAMLTLLLGAPLAAHPPTEWLAPSDRDALDIAEEIRTELKTKTVYVGRGENSANWTRRISVWFYPRVVLERGEFAAWIEGLRQDVVADCPGARATELRVFDWRGLPAAEFGVVCQYYPATGRTDIYFLRTMQGRTGQLVAAITFRTAPTETETEAAQAYLDTLALCTARSTEPACAH